MKNHYTSTLYHGQFSQTFAKFSILSPSWKLISCKQYMYPFGLEPLSIFSSPPYPILDIPLISLILKGWLKDSIFTRQYKMAHELLSSLLVNQKCTF